MVDAEEFVAIRRKKDSLYYPRWTTIASSFLPIGRAKMIVKVDLGRDLSEFEFLTKDQLRGERQLKW